MFITIYLIGCVFAFLICINEALHMGNHDETHRDYDDSEPQYGIIMIVILLSWVAVIAWVIRKIENKKNN